MESRVSKPIAPAASSQPDSSAQIVETLFGPMTIDVPARGAFKAAGLDKFPDDAIKILAALCRLSLAEGGDPKFIQSEAVGNEAFPGTSNSKARAAQFLSKILYREYGDGKQEGVLDFRSGTRMSFCPRANLLEVYRSGLLNK